MSAAEVQQLPSDIYSGAGSKLDAYREPLTLAHFPDRKYGVGCSAECGSRPLGILECYMQLV